MTMFDTLRAAQRLRDEADQPPAAAETIAAVIGEAVAPGRDDVMALREDVAGLRTELHDGLAALRTELHDEVASLREDMAALRAEVREDIAALRGELREGLQSMRTEMQAMRADFQSDMRTLTLQLFGITVGVATVAVAVAKLI